MRTLFGLAAIIVLLGTAAWWHTTGAHRGWSKNSVAVKTLDEITGIEEITEEKRFVPGIDTLAIGAVTAAALGGASLLFKKGRPVALRPAS